MGNAKSAQGDGSVQLFEDMAPADDEERKLFEQVSPVIGKSTQILEKLKNYQGCEDVIRKAITTPNPQTEAEAWGQVVPTVMQLKEFFDFAYELESCVPRLIQGLCKDKDGPQKSQSLIRKLAELVDFFMRFDALKMAIPALQNDFSYYRRTVNRMKADKVNNGNSIKEEDANRMSLFFAYPAPMMKVINEMIKNYAVENSNVEMVSMIFCSLANKCCTVVDQKKVTDDDVILFYVNVMTGSIVLYDLISPQGAFIKKTPINVKACVNLLKSRELESHLNALRFMTIHLNGNESHRDFKKLLER